MIIAILGPTAVGKTALSIALAKKYNAEVINFDAIQVYDKLDIGTAKIKEEEKEGIKHHLISHVSFFDNYSVYNYQKDARRIINNLLKKKKNIVLVGGTGLYLKATLFDYVFKESKTVNNFDDLTNEEILEKIKEFKVEKTPHVNNRQRLVRLLNKLLNQEEITYNKDKLLYENTFFIGLKTSREILYEKINLRVDKMFKEGLLEEVESLKDYYKTSPSLNKAIGYKEFIPYFDNKITLLEVSDMIKKNSRHYAKRQFTFFNHQFKVKWFDTYYDNFDLTINNVINYIENNK